MGIRGLTSFVDGVSDVWTKIELRDTRVIIDANALLFYLQTNIDNRFGGQYDRIAQNFEHFFACFQSNKVKTYVVFDGPTLVSDKKLETVISRAKETIRKCHSLFKETSRPLVDPPLTSSLLVQKLQKLEIPFSFCDGEADKEIASLANQWKCPVISNDSDFFIYDCPAGYIPLSHLHYTKNSINAELFNRQKLLQHLKIKEVMLPLLASLSGNDFIGSDVLEILGKVVKINDATDARKCSKNSLRIQSVCNYLRRFNTRDEALQSVLNSVSSEEKPIIERALLGSLVEYEITNSILEAYFRYGDTSTSLDNIPYYVIERYRNGNFPMHYLGVICSFRNILKFQVENMEEISSNCCSARLRRIAYGILRPREESIKEWDRDGQGLNKNGCNIQPLFDPIPNYGDLPTLKGIGEKPKDVKKLLLAILQSNDTICSLPDDEQLFASSIHYWILHANPKVTKEAVKILILQYLVQQKPSELSHSSQKKKREPIVDPVLLHSLAQWQSVMAETLRLNKMLLDALPEPDLSRVFNGIPAHEINHAIVQGKSLEAILNPLDDFDRIYSAVTEGLGDHHWFTKKKVKSKQKKKKNTDTVVTSASNRFAVLQLRSDDDDNGDDDE